MSRSPDPRLIVALDLSTPKVALTLVEILGESVGFYKLGLELGYGGA